MSLQTNLNVELLVLRNWYEEISIWAKLTQEQANNIRCEYSNGGISLLKLSVKYGVSKRTILNIVHWKIYK